MLDISVMNHIQLDIINGVSRQDSKYVTDDETGRFWNGLVAEFEAHPDRAYGFAKE